MDGIEMKASEIEPPTPYTHMFSTVIMCIAGAMKSSAQKIASLKNCIVACWNAEESARVPADADSGVGGTHH